MTNSVKCYKCTMTFRVEFPTHTFGQFAPESTKCAECGKLFWNSRWQSGGRARVGVYPDDNDWRVR